MNAGLAHRYGLAPAADPERGLVFNRNTFVFRLSVVMSDKGGLAAAAAACGLRPSDMQEVIWQPEFTSLDRLAVLATGLGVSLDWLFFGEGRP